MTDWKQKGRILIDLRRYGEAAAEYLNALTENPDDAWSLSQLGYCQANSGQAALGLESAKAAVHLAPEQPHAHYAMAVCHFTLGNLHLALISAGVTLCLDPLDQGALLLTGRIMVTREEWRSALEPLNRVLERNPNHELARNLKTQALFRLGKKDEAKALNEETLRLGPENPFTIEIQGWMLHANGQLKEAEEKYDEAVRLSPGWEAAIDVKIELLKRRNAISRIFWFLGKIYEGDNHSLFLHFWFAVASLFVLCALKMEGGLLDVLNGVVKAILIVHICSLFSEPLSSAFLPVSQCARFPQNEILLGRWVAGLVCFGLFANFVAAILAPDAPFVGSIAFATTLTLTTLLRGFFFCTFPVGKQYLFGLAVTLCLVAMIGTVFFFWPVGIALQESVGLDDVSALPKEPIHRAGVIIWCLPPFIVLAVGYLLKDRK